MMDCSERVSWRVHEYYSRQTVIRQWPKHWSDTDNIRMSSLFSAAYSIKRKDRSTAFRCFVRAPTEMY